MTATIHTWVRTLGDFPLDPQAGLAWLWAADGNSILWISPAAGARFGTETDNTPPQLDHRGTLRSLMADLEQEKADEQPVRVQQIELMNSRHRDVFTCLARAVPLLQGGFGILVVAVGAPARSLEDIRTASLVSTPDKAPVKTSTVDEPMLQVATAAAPKPVIHTAPTPSAQPAWIKESETARRPLRFVWQTDDKGRFVHISRELSEAVGPSNAMLMNKNWQESVAGFGILESEDIQRGFESRDTWTAKPALWPVTGSDLGIPVEMAGMLVREDNQFAGFRGYGIARIERAIARPGTAEHALTADTMPPTESDEDRFGPAVQRVLAPPPSPVLTPRSETPVAQDNTSARTVGIVTVAPAGNSAAVVLPATEPVVQNHQSALKSPDFSAAVDLRRPLPYTLPAEDTVQPAIPKLEATPIPGPAPDSAKATISHAPAVTGSVRDLQKFIDTAHRPAEQRPVESPAEETQSDNIGKNLTPQERNAFREIARALGQTRQQEPDKDEPAGSTIPDQTVTQGTLPKETTPLRPARNPLQPNPLAPQDKTGWKQEAYTPAIHSDEAGNSDTGASGMPVVPFETVQNLRNQKKQGLAQQGPMATVLERLPVGILVMQNGQGIFANRMLMDMLGYVDFDRFVEAGGAEKLFGAQASHPDMDARTLTILDFKGEAVQVRATIQAISWNNQPATLTSFVPAAKNRPASVSESAELDMMATQAELRELQFVLDTATDGIISLDSNGRILGLNRSAEALFGFDQNEVAGESITTLLAPESHVAALDYLEGLKSNGVASIMNDGRDIVGRERHGGAIPLFMTLGRLGDNAKAQRFCAVLRDITSWKKAEAELREAKRIAEDSSANKTDFLARISHEVRTPLNAIIGFSQVMISESFGPVGNSKYAQYAKDIHASGQHVLSLVNDLLDLSKVSSGKMDLTFASVDIQTVVADCVAMIQPQANTGKIIVRSQLSTRLPPVVADERSLRQIVLNLLSNAIKFTDPGGQVIVSATFNERGEVVVRIRDTGIGMTGDEINQAMEPFRQIAGPRSAGGTGLGLPLTKALVEANRASFSLASEAGKGTLAEVVFPSTRVLAE